MHDAQPFPLDPIDPRGCGVEQQIDQMVFQQIHLVHIEDATVGGSQQARLETALAGLQGVLKVNGPHHPVFTGRQGQLDHRHGAPFPPQLLRRLQSVPAAVVHLLRPVGGTLIGATLYHLDLRQQAGQGPGRGRFGGPLMTADQHAPDGGIHSIEEQGRLHRLLADDGAEWVNRGLHRCPFGLLD